jgi:ferredoxin
MNYAQQILTALGYGAGHLRLIETPDIASLEAAVWSLPADATAPPAATFNLSNEKRTTLDFVFEHLLRHARTPREDISLARGAPFGVVAVDKQKCTLCMACVGACPESALLDSKERPQLKFIERNCVQCGLCEKTCPEDAITLSPRLLLAKQAKAEIVLNEAEIFACTKCGKPFATKQMIDNMLGRLTSHSMFSEPGALVSTRCLAAFFISRHRKKYCVILQPVLSYAMMARIPISVGRGVRCNKPRRKQTQKRLRTSSRRHSLARVDNR